MIRETKEMQAEEYLVLRAVRSGPHAPSGSSVRTRAGTVDDKGLRVETIYGGNREAIRLREQPDVLSVSQPLPIRLVAPSTRRTSSLPVKPQMTWGVQAVGADRGNWDAAAITVAVLDTGIDSAHEAFVGMNILERDFTGEGPGDSNGHGTHCAGTIFGRPVNNVRYGVAPTLQRALIGKVLDSEGNGTTKALLQAIVWALTEGAHIITMSLGVDFPGYVRALTEKGMPVELATSKALEGYRNNMRLFDQLAGLVRAAGNINASALLLAAAGNASRRDGTPPYELGVEPPAAAEGIISVGALEQTGDPVRPVKVAAFSNSGPSVAAPGVDILSARAGGGYIEMSGTSMATPHVAGVAALWAAKMLTEDGDIEIEELFRRVIAGARRPPGLDRADVGTGLIQAPPA